jgi:hypothetical protein
MHKHLKERSGKKTAGYVMVGAGFLIILVNAFAYLLDWNGEYTPLLIIGLALSVTGLTLTRNK